MGLASVVGCAWLLVSVGAAGPGGSVAVSASVLGTFPDAPESGPTSPPPAPPGAVSAAPGLPSAPAQGAAPGQAAAPQAAERPRRVPVVSLTITPFYNAWELFELTRPDLFPIVAMSVELRAVHPNLGIELVGLVGDYDTTTMYSGALKSVFYELGAEPRVYPFGNFRSGMIVGGALRYFREHLTIGGAPFDFAGYVFGPFVGYKHTTRLGFTVEVKGGIAYVDRTMSDQGKHTNMLPLSDVKIGWSF
jgi:hypothetical protein